MSYVDCPQWSILVFWVKLLTVFCFHTSGLPRVLWFVQLEFEMLLVSQMMHKGSKMINVPAPIKDTASIEKLFFEPINYCAFYFKLFNDI